MGFLNKFIESSESLILMIDMINKFELQLIWNELCVGNEQLHHVHIRTEMQTYFDRTWCLRFSEYLHYLEEKLKKIKGSLLVVYIKWLIQ